MNNLNIRSLYFELLRFISSFKFPFKTSFKRNSDSEFTLYVYKYGGIILTSSINVELNQNNLYILLFKNSNNKEKIIHSKTQDSQESILKSVKNWIKIELAE